MHTIKMLASIIMNYTTLSESETISPLNHLNGKVFGTITIMLGLRRNSFPLLQIPS